MNDPKKNVRLMSPSLFARGIHGKQQGGAELRIQVGPMGILQRPFQRPQQIQAGNKAGFLHFNKGRQCAYFPKLIDRVYTHCFQPVGGTKTQITQLNQVARRPRCLRAPQGAAGCVGIR